MNSEAIDTYRPSPPPPPGAQAPPPPPTLVAASTLVAVPTRKALTWANWAKASGLGFAVFFAISAVVPLLGLRASSSTIGVIGWIAGAFIGGYVANLRYAKAYAAVFGGVFLAVLAFDAVILAFMA